jgi:prepilin-type N-terminal cleavage/methylation domain-containing protein
MNSPHILEGCPLNHPRIGRYGMKIAGYPGIMTFRFPSRVIRTRTGFTIVELMIVIAIIVIGAAIGIPAYNITIRPTADLKGAARRLYSDVQLARLRAVSRNVAHGLDFYAPECYRVFTDNNLNAQYDAGDQEVKVVNLANDYPNVQFDTSQGGGDGVSFAADSFAMTSRGLPAGVATGQDSVFLKNGKGEGRQIVVNTMGGVRIQPYNP